MNSSSQISESPKSNFLSSDFLDVFLEKRSWEPGWLVDFRKESWEKYLDLPKERLKDENWRFSPRSRFGYSNFPELTKSERESTLNCDDTSNVFFESLNQTILDSPSILSDLPNFTEPNLGSISNLLLCRTFAENGFVLKAPKQFHSNSIFKTTNFAPPNNMSRFQQNFIFLEPYSELTLLEWYKSEDNSSGLLSNTSNIFLSENSILNRVVIQKLNHESTFLHHENIELQKGSQFNNIIVQLGSSQSRIESKGSIFGEGAEFNNSSICLGIQKQLFDQRTIQHHSSPNSNSNLLFKNALLDEAKSVFSGMIKVDPEAQNTDAFQTNRNLLLSNEAEADSLPGLEILANEVKCSHGATTSKIDDQELFYLLSRGIPKRTCEKLVVLGFFDEVISKIKNDDLLNRLRNEISAHFDTTS